MALSSYAVPLIGSALLMMACYFLGRFNYSSAWIVILVGLNFLKSAMWRAREKRLMALRQTAVKEKEVILAQLQDLPAWVQFPDTERVEWINKVLHFTAMLIYLINIHRVDSFLASITCFIRSF